MVNGSMGKAIITLSFDDGRKDTYDVFTQVLKKMNIPATVNVPSGYIEAGYSNPLEVGYNGLMTKNELDEIAKNPLFEIAGHGFMHKNEDDDVQKGIEKLKAWYPNIERYGFASPHSLMKDHDVYNKKPFYNDVGIEYVRLGRKFWGKNYYRRGLSKMASLTGSSKLYIACYNKSLNSINSDFVLHAIPIIKTTRYEQVKSIIKYCVKKKKWCILEIHGIDKPGSDEYQELFCWNYYSFVKLCKWIARLREEGILEIKNALDVLHEGC